MRGSLTLGWQNPVENVTKSTFRFPSQSAKRQPKQPNIFGIRECQSLLLDHLTQKTRKIHLPRSSSQYLKRPRQRTPSKNSQEHNEKHSNRRQLVKRVVEDSQDPQRDNQHHCRADKDQDRGGHIDVLIASLDGGSVACFVTGRSL